MLIDMNWVRMRTDLPARLDRLPWAAWHYRVLHTIESGRLVVLVIKIGRRREVYG